MENNSKVIQVYPVIESDWWEKDTKEIGILPNIIKWSFPAPETGFYTKSSFSWPWWKTVDNDFPLFINYVTGIVGVEANNSSGKDIDFLLNASSINEIIFDLVIPEDKWKLEYISDKFLCNVTQRKTYPDLALLDEYLMDKKDDIKSILKIAENEPNVVGKVGTWKYIYLPTNQSVLFDIHITMDYGLNIEVGIEEKVNPNISAKIINKKLSLIESLILPSRKYFQKLLGINKNKKDGQNE